ncbi:hypothetical protein TSUD_294950 [Trifolium subterraneum]|uniref:Reverse transcriptase zinc-binding domain-containing protein n=1 Tax=Trifolium subterraneum TaxID=3900 RepID=A0A2Z6MU15_TRISU|nr:hypothetical protein TSUD_294950 [Trifolium subterraneum]
MLVGVNIPESWLGEAASALRCRVGKIPFIYLGLPVGGDPRRLGFWEPVLARLKKRLSGWKSRFLSFGGLPVGGDPRRLGFWEPVLARLKKRLSGWKSRFLSFGGKYLGLVGTLFAFARSMKREIERWGEEREIVRIRDNGGGLGGAWFGECIVKKVGDGTDTLFWSDPWVDGIPLCMRFRRLFDLAETQLCSVAEMASLDSWLWQPDPDNGYSVRSAYHLLTFQDSVPLNVSILAWRLLRDRLPTKANLVTRGILSPEAHFCVSGCGAVESAQHLFLSCSTFGHLWALVSYWVGSPLVDSHTIPDHFSQFTLLAGGSRGRRVGLYGISEIPDVSVAQQIHYSTCWTRLRIILIGG